MFPSSCAIRSVSRRQRKGRTRARQAVAREDNCVTCVSYLYRFSFSFYFRFSFFITSCCLHYFHLSVSSFYCFHSFYFCSSFIVCIAFIFPTLSFSLSLASFLLIFIASYRLQHFLFFFCIRFHRLHHFLSSLRMALVLQRGV